MMLTRWKRRRCGDSAICVSYKLYGRLHPESVLALHRLCNMANEHWMHGCPSCRLATLRINLESVLLFDKADAALLRVNGCDSPHPIVQCSQAPSRACRLVILLR